MKKMICIVIILFVFCSNTVFAAPQLSAEIIDRRTKQPPLLESVGEDTSSYGYWFDFQGRKYIIGQSQKGSTVPLLWDDAIPVPQYSIQYIVAGDYYMVRSCSYDPGWNTYGMKGRGGNYPIQFYDKEGNLVAEKSFDYYPSQLGYYNGIYYCGFFDSDLVMKSTDLVNWEETDQPVPRRTGNVTYTENAVSFDETSPLAPVIYEDGVEREFVSTLGDWILMVETNSPQKEHAFYLSNDNVYFVKIEIPYCNINHDGRVHLDQYGNLDGFMDISKCESIFHRGDYYRVWCIYEYQDQIVMEATSSGWHPYLRLTVPKDEIYAELDAQKQAPYVKLNDTVLAFEQPPVIEDDRTLVPMRFLFEQLGAEVEWDGETRTATVTQNNEGVVFQIDSTIARVNSRPATMDVPARLINDKTMVPLRFLSENLGYTVEWDGTTNTAIITE